MSAFDASALWQELQNEEDSFRSKVRTRLTQSRDNTFWRKPRTEQKRKTQKNRWKNVRETDRLKSTNQESQCRINSIKHALNLLSDTECGTAKRTHCLQFINAYLDDYAIQTKPNHNKSSPNNTMDILKSVIKVFVDPKEPLRIQSIDIICNHIGNENPIWDYQTSIKYIIPIVVHCILSDEYQEKSEEVRLKFVSLLQRIIEIARNEEDIKPICGDLVAILLRLLSDPYSEINKNVCSLFISLSTKIRLHAVSKLVIENALQLLSHRHSNVRIAAIRLIECMLMNGGHEAIQKLTGFREHNVVPLEWWFQGEIRANYFGALCRHEKYAVRKAFYAMIFNVMTNMPERYDYKTLLLSYALSGLQDANEDIQAMTFEAIEKIGKMHEEDEYNNLQRELFHQQQAEEITKRHFHGDDDEDEEQQKFVLPFPFKHRPCLGARVLIREHFARIIHAALSEFADWKDECREMAVLLVRNMIIYSEEYCTQNAELLLTSLSRCVGDKNRILATVSRECCSLIGRYIYPMIWMDYLCDMMYHEFEARW
eukprot:CAMPEP_0197030588 /NCGR_PEP_ID=MMETSP1384-20130603/9801_1 /TAXON_ID=29189 /ORGANISM="Ammonia sp." /LENGTH=540 /DNA_ID=CAMNT_0042459973 /DNA_START=27 /DNA_END=1646 /DNA_ORIENTATION=+